MQIEQTVFAKPVNARTGRFAAFGREHAPYLAVLVLVVVVYATLNTLQDYANYLAGRSLFDLAVYEQGFWNGLGNPPFFYSLEGPMSRFGRHFSPVFYVILPFYLLHSDPLTLEAAQSIAIALGALPLYFLASERLGKSFGLLIAVAYLLNPAVHDVNLKNDFHEISLAMPALLLFIYSARRSSTALCLFSLLLALATREEVSLTTLLFGMYLIVFGRNTRRGLIIAGISLVWFLAVFEWVMPAFNVGKVFPLAAGYGYLGHSVSGIVLGAIKHPRLLIAEVTRPPKLAYVFWLAEPLAFLCLLAPEVLGVASIALMIVLASNYPYTYELFERYAAPIVPFVFYAAIVGVQRISHLVPQLRPRAWSMALGGLILVATFLSQVELRKLPLDIQAVPSARTEAAFDIAGALPAAASVSAADHRWLAHLAHRRELYALTAQSPETDFVMFDLAHAPVTNTPPAELRRIENRFLTSPDYQVLRCETGLYLLGRVANRSWNQNFLARSIATPGSRTRFGQSIYLTRIHPNESLHPGMTAMVDLNWLATGTVGTDYHVFVHLVDQSGTLVSQHDGPPGQGLCSARYWTTGLVVDDPHPIHIPANVLPGRYELDVGLYDFKTMQRLPAFDEQGHVIGDQRRLPVDIASSDQ